MFDTSLTSLIYLKPGVTAQVVSFSGGRRARMRIMQLGINPGDRIRVLSVGPFGGAIYIENLSNGTRVAIGRGIATKIIVKPL